MVCSQPVIIVHYTPIAWLLNNINKLDKYLTCNNDCNSEWVWLLPSGIQLFAQHIVQQKIAQKVCRLCLVHADEIFKCLFIYIEQASEVMCVILGIVIGPKLAVQHKLNSLPVLKPNDVKCHRNV